MGEGSLNFGDQGILGSPFNLGTGNSCSLGEVPVNLGGGGVT